MRKLLIITAFLFSGFLLYGQYRLVEEFTTNEQFKQGGIPFIPYSKYVFDNGLTLLINQDHSDPAVTISFVHKFGSAASPIDRHPMVYLIARLLYGPGVTSIQELQSKAVDFNWSVEPDKIEVSYTCSKDMIRQVLTDESNRLKHFINKVNPDSFNAEKEFLIRYMYNRSATDIFYDAYHHGLKTIYPMSHPYGRHIEGRPDHLEFTTLEDMQMFYYEWFGANNLIISISGDIEVKDVLKQVNNVFKDHYVAENNISRIKTNLELRKKDESQYLRESRYLTLTRSDNISPKLIMVFPTVPKYDPSEHFMEMAAILMGDPKKGVITKALLDAKLASKVNIYHKSNMHFGEFRIEVDALSGVSLQIVKDSILSLIKRSFDPENPALMEEKRSQIVSEAGITTQQYEESIYNKIISANETLKQKITQKLETTLVKASKLANYELFLSNPGYLSNMYMSTFHADLNAFTSIYYQYFIDAPFIAISIVNKEETNLKAGNDNFIIAEPSTVIHNVKAEEIKTLPLNAKSRKVPKAKQKSVTPPLDFNIKVFENGCVFKTYQDADAHFVNIRFVYDLSTHPYVVLNPLFSSIMKELFETKYKTLMEGELIRHFELSGSSMNIHSTNDILIFEIITIKENLHSIKEFLRELLMYPAPIPIDLEKKAHEIINEREKSGGNIVHLFDVMMFNILYDYSIERQPPHGSPEQRIVSQLIKLIEIMPDITSPEFSTIIITGNASEGDLADFMETFRHKHTEYYTINATRKKEISFPSDSRIYFNHREKLKNASLIINFLRIPTDNLKDLYFAQYLNYILTDVDDNIFKRNFEGKSYIKNIAINTSSKGGYLYYYINAEVSEESVALFMQEVNNIFEQLSSGVLKRKQIKEWKLPYIFAHHIAYESLSQKTDLLAFISKNNLKKDYLYQKQKTIKKVNHRKLKKFVVSNINAKNHIYVISGNRKNLSEKLNNAGFTNIDYMNAPRRGNQNNENNLNHE